MSVWEIVFKYSIFWLIVSKHKKLFNTDLSCGQFKLLLDHFLHE